jgi:hypothetical protein
MAESCDSKVTSFLTLAPEILNISAAILVRSYIYTHAKHFIVQKIVSMRAVDEV